MLRFIKVALLIGFLGTAAAAQADIRPDDKCGSDCLSVKQTLINGKKDLPDAYGHFVNLTTTLGANGYDIKRVFIQRNQLRADYRSCDAKQGDVICSFPAFNLFYGRKPDAKDGDILTYKIRAWGEDKETGEMKIIKDSFQVRYRSPKRQNTVETEHVSDGLLRIMQDPGNPLVKDPESLQEPLIGTILDSQSNLPIPNARVRIFPIIANEKFSDVRSIKSDPAGMFTLGPTAPYSFSMHVEAKGYQPYSSGILARVKKIELELQPLRKKSLPQISSDDGRIHQNKTPQ